MQSPKQVFVRTLKFSFVVYGVSMAVLYGTTHSAQQMEVSNVVAALGLLIVVLFAFWRALGVEHANHAEWLKTCAESIHYPIASEFENKVTTFEKERRTVRINEFV